MHVQTFNTVATSTIQQEQPEHSAHVRPTTAAVHQLGTGELEVGPDGHPSAGLQQPRSLEAQEEAGGAALGASASAPAQQKAFTEQSTYTSEDPGDAGRAGPGEAWVDDEGVAVQKQYAALEIAGSPGRQLLHGRKKPWKYSRCSR